MIPVKYCYFPTHTVTHSLVLNHQRHPSSVSVSLKYGHQPSILLTWDSDPVLLDGYPAPIWIPWLGTERLVNPTSTALPMEEVTSLHTTVKFLLSCSKG